MFMNKLALVAFSALLPSVLASSPWLQNFDNLVSDQQILAEFEKAGHPDATPQQTWTDNKGEVYRSHYMFDTAEWNSMHYSLLEQAGVNITSLNELAVRAPKGEPDWYCTGYESNPYAYTLTLGSITGAICTAMNYGAEALGKTQVVKQNVPTVTNTKAIAVFKFTWKSFKWASNTACGVSMAYGINQACDSPHDGVKGKQKATRGFRETYKDGAAASLDLNKA